jgi:N-acetylmuramoyl-L-alanine amidase
MKRYFIKISIIFILCIALFSQNIVLASLPLTGKTIIIDVGHGGVDPGTVYQNVYEKDINLSISLLLEKELSRLGASVVLIRNGDYDLSKPNAYMRKKSDFDNRIKIINESKADYYLSIHLNYLENKKYYGPQVFYNNQKDSNKEIALQLQNDLNQELHTSREVKLIPTKTYMYSRLNIPGVLIECGFLSNDYERELLLTKDYQKKLAQIIASSMGSLKF